MCFLCKQIGELVVMATTIDGKPQLYAHQKCIDKHEAEIAALMFEDSIRYD